MERQLNLRGAALWDGVTTGKTLTSSDVRERRRLAEAATVGDWQTAFGILSIRPDLINAVRLESEALLTPLHEAASVGAPRDVVERLLALGAWRNLRNGWGERPLDSARTAGCTELLDVLEPRVVWDVPVLALRAIQRRTQRLMRGASRSLVEKQDLRLPELLPLLELRVPRMWFRVPGMGGGFDLELDVDGGPSLVVSTWVDSHASASAVHRVTAVGVFDETSVTDG